MLSTKYLMSNIPKNLLVVSRTQMPEYVSDQYKDWAKGWNLTNMFSIDHALEYFDKNPNERWPDIKSTYMFWQGAFRADLIRFYWLYTQGGFVIDDDAMFGLDLDDIVQEYDLVSAEAVWPEYTQALIGFIGCIPNHPAIGKMIDFMSEKPNVDVCHIFCIRLHQEIITHSGNYFLFPKHEGFSPGVHDVLDKDDRLIMRHYQQTKIIPFKS